MIHFCVSSITFVYYDAALKFSASAPPWLVCHSASPLKITGIHTSLHEGIYNEQNTETSNICCSLLGKEICEHSFKVIVYSFYTLFIVTLTFFLLMSHVQYMFFLEGF